jgi:hypothetical protein
VLGRQGVSLMPGHQPEQEDVVTDQLTSDGTITDVPAPLKTCPICKAEFFVEAVSTLKGGHHSTGHGKRYTLRCANGHEKTWVQGAIALSDPE